MCVCVSVCGSVLGWGWVGDPIARVGSKLSFCYGLFCPMGNCFVGGPVKCVLVGSARFLIAKDRLRKRDFKEMTDGFSNMLIFAKLQPKLAKGILLKREIAIQFHKGYNVLFATGESGHAYSVTVKLTKCCFEGFVWVDFEDVTVLCTRSNWKSLEPASKRSRQG